MTVTRLRDIPGIGVDAVGDAADAANDPEFLRLENLDTDVRPPAVALTATRAAVGDDAANSYLPFQGHRSLREAAAAHVGRIAGRRYDPDAECVSVAGGLNGILNTLLATVEPGQEVVLCDPVYAGLVNRVRLAGGVPRFVPAAPTAEGWTIDAERLAGAVGPDTAAVLTMGPTMPTGLVLDDRHWSALAGACERHDAWLVYDAAMERIRFDGRPPSHPAAHDGLAARTITVGSASKELRLIGWRVGWVVGPAPIVADIRLVGLTNVVCQVGLAQNAVAAALDAPDAEADVAAATAEWQRRCERVLDRLAGYPVIRPHGGWSLLIDTRPLGLTAAELSWRLFHRAKVAATPMDGWGPGGTHYLRLVFANEPLERLTDLKERFDQAVR
ncbi:aspartate/methionine/tyrosine aminotransferase [Actinomadura coerulea]|uniref:Aspartate/methionine/tyrosine aminotransferase n=1 Tax=Actinomadura coerulea TaxID=46159 RepID=A0A7X0FY26_9ACTN|nr:pyridoxal phosphate-dependent aminotransferase [Actinomadura coerulea]MBB6395654.1 aspartate/methionine/tyrosine aminotransferase [Actinomadura coerulea]GGQ24786.1 arginine--pyruvate transaminase AruH [Actinomadura coerulea]